MSGWCCINKKIASAAMKIPRTQLQLVATLLLLCALTCNVSAEEDSYYLRRRGSSNHRTRPHDDVVEQPLGVIARDDYGNTVEVAAAASQPQEQQTPLQTAGSFRPQQTKIVNGDRPDLGDAAYPFLAQLRLGGDIFCGGQLIAPDVVLTAAHCIEDFMPSRVTIWNGSFMQDRIPQKGVIHPDYDSSELINDLALIKLTVPALAVNEVNDGGRTYWELEDDLDWIETPPIIRMQRYQTPSQCTSLYSQGLAEDITTMTVIGHGTIKLGGSLSGELLEADVHYVLNSQCDKQYYGAGWITDDMICASDIEEEQDACQGDSGGPLFTRLPAGGYNLFTLVGTVSWGNGCAEKKFPGVYSRVAANTDWVDEAVCGANGYSPNSCTADGKIRDFALDSLTGATSVSRRTKKNVVSFNARAALYGEKLKEEVCELLGGNADETPSPSTSRPRTSDSPSRAPIIAPTSRAPVIAPTSSSPSKPPGKSPTKKFITTDKKANQKAKGIMYQLQAETGDVIIESISFETKDDKDTNVEVYFRLGTYEDFPGKGMNANAWGRPVFDGIPARTANGLREAVLDDALTIPKGEMASIYLAGKKEFMFQKGGQEFTVSDDAGDFKVFTGAAMKKPFQQRLMNADFFGGITYYTYIEGTKVTATPSLSPVSLKNPTLPPIEDDTSSPSMLPPSSPSEDKGGGGGGADGAPKEFTTPKVDKAEAGAKGVMFSITAKSKEVSITGLGLMGTKVKASDLWVYYQNGSYDDFKALDEDKWNEVFKGKVVLDPDELVDVELAKDISIPAGGTVSLYVLSKKGVLYTKSSASEFDIYAASEDFYLRVGTTTKKEFEKPEKLAEFAGRITYQT